MDFSWMAWSVPTAIFFIAVGALLAVMSVLAFLAPSPPRVGWLGFATERGDRLFIALLGSAYIHLAWLAFTDASLWFAVVLSAIYASVILRFA